MISGIHTAMVGIGYGLLVLFFAMGVFQSAASFRDFQRPEFLRRLIHILQIFLQLLRGYPVCICHIVCVCSQIS